MSPSREGSSTAVFSTQSPHPHRLWMGLIRPPAMKKNERACTENFTAASTPCLRDGCDGAELREPVAPLEDAPKPLFKPETGISPQQLHSEVMKIYELACCGVEERPEGPVLPASMDAAMRQWACACRKLLELYEGAVDARLITSDTPTRGIFRARSAAEGELKAALASDGELLSPRLAAPQGGASPWPRDGTKDGSEDDTARRSAEESSSEEGREEEEPGRAERGGMSERPATAPAKTTAEKGTGVPHAPRAHRVTEHTGDAPDPKAQLSKLPPTPSVSAGEHPPYCPATFGPNREEPLELKACRSQPQPSPATKAPRRSMLRVVPKAWQRDGDALEQPGTQWPVESQEASNQEAAVLTCRSYPEEDAEQAVRVGCYLPWRRPRDGAPPRAPQRVTPRDPPRAVSTAALHVARRCRTVDSSEEPQTKLVQQPAGVPPPAADLALCEFVAVLSRLGGTGMVLCSALAPPSSNRMLRLLDMYSALAQMRPMVKKVCDLGNWNNGRRRRKSSMESVNLALSSSSSSGGGSSGSGSFSSSGSGSFSSSGGSLQLRTRRQWLAQLPSAVAGMAFRTLDEFAEGTTTTATTSLQQQHRRQLLRRRSLNHVAASRLAEDNASLDPSSGPPPLVTAVVDLLLQLGGRHRAAFEQILAAHPKHRKGVEEEIVRAARKVWAVAKDLAAQSPDEAAGALLLLNSAAALCRLEKVVTLPADLAQEPHRQMAHLTDVALRKVRTTVALPPGQEALSNEEIDSRLADFNRQVEQLALDQLYWVVPSGGEWQQLLRRSWAQEITSAYSLFLESQSVRPHMFSSYRWDVDALERSVAKKFFISRFATTKGGVV